VKKFIKDYSNRNRQTDIRTDGHS